MKIKNNLLTLILLSTLMVFMSGCSMVLQSLDRTNWNLSEYRNNAGDLVKPLVGSVVTANFQAEKVSGIAGCNNYSASYQVEGRKITFSSPISTRKTCSRPAGIMSQEHDILANISSASAFQIRGDKLIFTDSRNNILLTFSPK